MKISVLDQSTAAQGRPEAVAIAETLALARRCDALGYHRYWVSEHHNSDSIVGTAPEILIAAIAATTAHIRVGSAGVMLPHYAALKVAEQFRVLEAIAPGRIDLGVGRAPGSDRLTAFALNPDAMSAADRFPQQVIELAAMAQRRAAGGRSSVCAPDGSPARTDCAGSLDPRQLGLWRATGCAFRTALRLRVFLQRRTRCRASARTLSAQLPAERAPPQPQATICIWALAADSDEEARRLATTREYWRVGFEKGLRTALVSPDHAMAHPYDATGFDVIERMRRKAFVGTAHVLAGRLRDEAARLGLDELVIVTWTFDPAARVRSYELLADAFALTNQA